MAFEQEMNREGGWKKLANQELSNTMESVSGDVNLEAAEETEFNDMILTDQIDETLIAGTGQVEPDSRQLRTSGNMKLKAFQPPINHPPRSRSTKNARNISKFLIHSPNQMIRLQIMTQNRSRMDNRRLAKPVDRNI